MEVSKNKSSFFDVICKFDNQFYGHKLKWFIIHSIFIVIAFNFCEFFKLNSSPWDIIVVIAYFFMIIITFLAWIGSWRDDDGNWSWNRFSFKLKMYLILWKKSQNKIKNKSGKEYLYYLGAFLFLFGACSKAIYLLTLYLRFLSKDLISINLLNNYVVFFNFSFWIGIAILIYLAIKHKEVFDVKSFFNKKKFDNVSLNLVKSNEANLININNDHQVNQLKEINRNTLIGEIVNILQNWKPDQYDKEWKYQDDLENQFHLELENVKIEHQKYLKSVDGFRNFPDIVLNDNIIIEMKAKRIASEFDRVQGQLNKYINLWENKGPVILVINNVEYDHAKKKLSTYFNEKMTLNQDLIGFVI